MIRVLHAFIWFSISKGGGTCDLINKLAIAQQKRNDIVPIIFSSKNHFDKKLAMNLDKTSFYFVK